jgi:hypothetical protein
MQEVYNGEACPGPFIFFRSDYDTFDILLHAVTIHLYRICICENSTRYQEAKKYQQPPHGNNLSQNTGFQCMMEVLPVIHMHQVPQLVLYFIVYLSGQQSPGPVTFGRGRYVHPCCFIQVQNILQRKYCRSGDGGIGHA